jgi:hypothetical protein
MTKPSKKTFKIILFSSPTEDHFTHYYKEAQYRGIGPDKFLTLWFKACNDYSSMMAKRAFESRRYKMAEVLINKGLAPATRNAGRRFLNNAAIKVFDGLGIAPPLLQLEEEE